MKFVDQAIINIEAGAGGNGCVSFRREKFIPKGGPNGGDGGHGGSVYLIGKKQLQTLADLEYKCSYKAQRGQHGRGSDKNGRVGEDIYIPVPLGTDVYDLDNNKYIGEVVETGQVLLAGQGGKGGRGNTAFKSSTNRAPRVCEAGADGQKIRLKLILRLIADVGLVGLPNAGKSTLLAQITKAHPKIADYPFTTLSPNLGVFSHALQTFTVADMPGIIEGASQGKGLGLVFLRHIERTKTIVYIIDYSQTKPMDDLKIIQHEIRNYNPDILNKNQIVVFNKIDLVKKVKKLKVKLPAFYISALNGQGIKEFVSYLQANK